MNHLMCDAGMSWEGGRTAGRITHSHHCLVLRSQSNVYTAVLLELFCNLIWGNWGLLMLEWKLFVFLLIFYSLESYPSTDIVRYSPTNLKHSYSVNSMNWLFHCNLWHLIFFVSNKKREWFIVSGSHAYIDTIIA